MDIGSYMESNIGSYIVSKTCSYETATNKVWTRNTKLNSMVNTKIFTALANIFDQKN